VLRQQTGRPRVNLAIDSATVVSELRRVSVVIIVAWKRDQE
jgi:hypothetical protein